MAHGRHHSLSTIVEEPSNSPRRTHRASNAHYRDSDTLLIKLRNPHTNPPEKKLFHLPKDRLLQTSMYFRDRVDMSEKSSPSAASSPLTPCDSTSSKPKDGIFRLNFPDFEIFSMYEEWLRSGTIHTKSSLRTLHTDRDAPRDKEAPQDRYHDDRDTKPDRNTVHAFQDYLGAYFLGTWLQDTTFKDSLISLILSTINSPGPHSNSTSPSPSTSTSAKLGDNAHNFLAALKPSLIELVLADEQSTRGMRRLIYAAIATFAEPEDMARLVPDKGRTCERGFVRGLLGYLLVAQRQRRGVDTPQYAVNDARQTRRYEEAEKDHGKRTREEECRERQDWAMTEFHPSNSQPAVHTQLSMAQRPRPFMPRMEDLWEAMSHVSWPSTSPDTSVFGDVSSVAGAELESAADTMTELSSEELGGTSETLSKSVSRTSRGEEGDKLEFVEWPRKDEDFCVFHEHTFLEGMGCRGSRVE
ncbi:hypothetical protein K491DRAFT_775294 [Lophiostoma macrostomum CBS 122681]|uniref:BTB domain-containing protein n=1 Tax=Lophiostoma macrostomum CBS 122681 TaxID=1314788 RepID=A0A6A6TLJ3_9PLEO|nr:hypothetical protein K491DRAFT_775294 [Lophiostoma macrostomum CBS 122681]